MGGGARKEAEPHWEAFTQNQAGKNSALDTGSSCGEGQILDIFFFFFLWPRHVAFSLLVPRPGIKPGPWQ